MNRQTVESSLINSIGYDPESKILEVEFKKGGATYQYENVEVQKYEDLRDSFSIGRYFLNYIKPNYSYKKV